MRAICIITASLGRAVKRRRCGCYHSLVALCHRPRVRKAAAAVVIIARRRLPQEPPVSQPVPESQRWDLRVSLPTRPRMIRHLRQRHPPRRIRREHSLEQVDRRSREIDALRRQDLGKTSLDAYGREVRVRGRTRGGERAASHEELEEDHSRRPEVEREGVEVVPSKRLGIHVRELAALPLSLDESPAGVVADVRRVMSVGRIGVRDPQAQAQVDEDDVALVIEEQVPKGQVAVTHSLLLEMRHRRQDLDESRPREGLVRQTGRRERHLVEEGRQQVAPRQVREDKVKVRLSLEGVGESGDVPVSPSE